MDGGEDVLRRIEAPIEHQKGRSSNVTVAVRVRPLLPREQQKGSGIVVTMSGGDHVSVAKPGAKGKTNSYAFDYAYWSTTRDGDWHACREGGVRLGGGVAERARVRLREAVRADDALGDLLLQAATAATGATMAATFVSLSASDRRHPRQAGSSICTSSKLESSF